MFDSKEEIIEEVKWNGEDYVTFSFKGGMGWAGAKRKDFWNPDSNWEEKIAKGSVLRLWTVRYSIVVVGFELRMGDGKWESVWCATNNFGTKAERKKSENAYVNFIKDEGKKIAKLIDEGKTLEEIDKLIDQGHTGNTYACALGIGISEAKDKEKAEVVRKEHNKKWGVEDNPYKPEHKGVVNPAVLTIKS